MAIRFKRATKETWKNEEENKNAYPRKFNGGVMFPTSHDLHIEMKPVWMHHLQLLVGYKNDVLIVSKPEWESIKAICDFYQGYNDEMDRIEFRFTIGTNDDETRKFWEPGAPDISERLRCLRYVFEQGFKTSVSMEPLLMENPANFIKSRLLQSVSGEIWIGLMNYLHSNDFEPREMWWYHEQKRINSLENIQKVYEETKDIPGIKYKDSIRDLLGLGDQS
jgi:hypothetical protein